MDNKLMNSFDKAVKLNKVLMETLEKNLFPEGSILGIMTCLHARFVYEATEGYITLRQAGKCVAARQLLRPIVETVLWMAATEDHPDILFRWVLNNVEEERKVFLSNVRKDKFKQDINLQADNRLNDIRTLFDKEFPGSTANCSQISLLSALQLAGKRTGRNLENQYHELYRTYCQYTHATLNAKADNWDLMHPVDDDYIAMWGQSLVLLSLRNHTEIQMESNDIDLWIDDLQKSSRYK